MKLPELRMSLLAAYAAPALPLAALTLPVYIYLPNYYADDLGLGLAAVGAVLLFARLWDVISDPLIGWLSDRGHGPISRRWGRRRPWIVAGAPLMMAACWMLFAPPAGAGIAHLLVWSIALYLGWTMMILPLTALSAELSGDYDERSRIAAWRESFTLAGTLATLGGLALLDGFGATVALRWVGGAVVLLLPICTAIMVWRVPDISVRRDGQLSAGSGWRMLRANRPFQRLIAAYLLNGFANGLPATLFLLFVGRTLQAPSQAGLLLFVYFLSGIAAVPLWLRLSYRYGKHRVWCAAMLVSCAVFAATPFLGAGDVGWFAAVCVLTGLCLGADLVLPSAMQADVVDLDSIETGERRAGLFFALWGMATKLALALAVGVAFPLLDWSGEAAFMLILLYSLLPIAFKLAAIALMAGYPLTAARHAEIAARLTAMTTTERTS